MAARARTAGDDGFTLFEVLVGLAISALVMLGLSSAMSSVNRGWQQSTAIGERQNMLATGLAVAGGDIARAERMFDNLAKPERFLFVGDRGELIFPLVERDGHNDKGIYWVRLYVRKADGAVELVRARAPYLPGPQDIAAIRWEDEVVLVRGNFDISLSYLAAGADVVAWENDWPMQNRLPRQVRIDVAAPAPQALRLPPYIVALQNGAELACAAGASRLCTLPTGGTLKPPAEGQQ